MTTTLFAALLIIIFLPYSSLDLHLSRADADVAVVVVAGEDEGDEAAAAASI